MSGSGPSRRESVAVRPFLKLEGGFDLSPHPVEGDAVAESGFAVSPSPGRSFMGNGSGRDPAESC